MKVLLAFYFVLFPAGLAAGAQDTQPAQVEKKTESRDNAAKSENERKQEEPRRQDRVRAKDPTVVTVEGRADAVKEDPGRSVGSKIGRGIRSAAGGTVRALGKLGGWLLNVDEDIPSDREGQEKEQQRSRKP